MRRFFSVSKFNFGGRKRRGWSSEGESEWDRGEEYKWSGGRKEVPPKSETPQFVERVWSCTCSAAITTRGVPKSTWRRCRTVKQDKKDRPASAALGKKDDGKDGDDGSDSSDIVSRPLDVTDLKTKAFVVTSRNESSNEINLVTVMVNNLYKS